MELEPSFFRLHAKLVEWYATAAGPRTRQIIEVAAAAIAVLLVASLVHLVCDPSLLTVLLTARADLRPAATNTDELFLCKRKETFTT